MKNGEKVIGEKKKQRNPLAFFFRHKPYFFNNNSNNKPQGLMITGIFGAPLEFAAQCGTITSFGLSVPDPINRCFNEILTRGLRIEGLFRLSGAAIEVEKLQYEFDKPPTYGKYLNLKDNDIHAITSLVKKYLRSLPDPVIPSVYHHHFLSLLDNWIKDDRSLVLQYAKLIQNDLPKTNFDVIHYIILVASWIQHYQHLNRMNPEALAVVLAPICSGLENNIYNQLKSTSNNNKLSSSSSSSTSSTRLTNDINISNYQQIKENMDQFIQLNIKWTSIWKLMIEHHDILLDYWRSTNLSITNSMSPRDVSHSLIWQRHSMPVSKIENTPLLWTQSTIEEKSNLINDDDDDDDGDDIPSTTAIFNNENSLSKINNEKENNDNDEIDRYNVIVIRKQHQGFRRRLLSGVAKDDENIYLDAPLPPLPIPSYPKDTTTNPINNHEFNMKSTKKRSFLLRRPKSIATLQPRMKATVL